MKKTIYRLFVTSPLKKNTRQRLTKQGRPHRGLFAFFVSLAVVAQLLIPVLSTAGTARAVQAEVYDYVGSAGEAVIYAKSGFWASWYSPAGNDLCNSLDSTETVTLCRQANTREYEGLVQKERTSYCTYVLNFVFKEGSNTEFAISFTQAGDTASRIKTSSFEEVCGAANESAPEFQAPTSGVMSSEVPVEVDASNDDVVSGTQPIPVKWVQGDLSNITYDNRDRFTDEYIQEICSDYWRDGDSDHFSEDSYNVCVQNATEHRDGLQAPEGSSSCLIEGVGWIVCPITTFLASVTDAAFGVISNFLVVNVQLLDTQSGTYAAWSAFRNLANVAFVIVFLIIIFSQLTGQGVTNYGVKKTLPRLIIGVILVNVSFFICQLAVDVTQVIGASLGDFLSNIPVSNVDTTRPSWSDVMGDVLMGTGIAALVVGAVVGGAAVLTLSVSLPVMLAVLLAVLMTVIILVGRQAAIVILIVIAPLAFIAYMLPNTEKWFKQWVKAFTALLMVYPIIALLYGGGELTAKILAGVANASGTDASMKFWLSLTAIAVAALPLVMTPSLLRGALNGIGQIGGRLSGLAKGASGRVGKTANTSSRFGEAKTGLKNRFALARAQRRIGSDLQQRVDRSRIGRALGLDRGASRALATVKEEEATELRVAKSNLGDEIADWKAKNENIDANLVTRALDKSRTQAERSAAMHELAGLGRDKAIRSLRTSAGFTADDEVSLQHAISSNAGALVSKAPDLVKTTGPAFDNVTGEQLANFSADTARVHAEYLRNLYQTYQTTGSVADRDAFNTAYTSFSTAIESMRQDPTLLAKFSGEAGRKYRDEFDNASTPAGFAAYLPSAIGPTGRIT